MSVAEYHIFKEGFLWGAGETFVIMLLGFLFYLGLCYSDKLK